MAVYGTGSVTTDSGLTISTSGGPDSNGNHSQGVYNGNGNGDAGGSTGGGTINLTNSTVVTSGVNADGVGTLNGGSMTLTGGTVATSSYNRPHLRVERKLHDAFRVQATTKGKRRKGHRDFGANTSLTGSNLTIVTTGAIDPATGLHSQGVFNGSAGSPDSGTTGGGDRHAHRFEGHDRGRGVDRRGYRKQRYDEILGRLDRDIGRRLHRRGELERRAHHDRPGCAGRRHDDLNVSASPPRPSSPTAAA